MRVYHRQSASPGALMTILGALILIFSAPPAQAQYVETLGPAQGIAIAPGTDMVSAGEGLFETGSGTIDLAIPAGVAVKQVLLYWESRDPANEVDDELVVDGTPVTGTLIGTAAAAVGYPAAAFRADITGVVSLVPGMVNSIAITGFDPAVDRRDGASIVAIFDDGSAPANIQILDGADFAWLDAPAGPAQVMVEQTFAFAAASIARTANLILMVGDATPERPDRLIVKVDGVVFLDQANFFSDACCGPQWSNPTVEVDIPAGATSMSVQAFSGAGEEPESLTWIFAGLSVPPEPMMGCTYTQGYWKNHMDAWPVEVLALGDETYTRSELVGFLNTPPRGDKSLILVRQLIPAKLNVANGASAMDVSDAIVAADAWLVEYGGVGAGVRRWNSGEPVHDTLEDYNEGRIGPGHCDDQEYAYSEGSEGDEEAEHENEKAAKPAKQAHAKMSAHPNPFNPQTTISVELATSAHVRLAVYDMLGREVALLIDNVLESGSYQTVFEAGHLPSGTYLYTLTTPEQTITRAVLLMK